MSDPEDYGDCEDTSLGTEAASQIILAQRNYYGVAKWPVVVWFMTSYILPAFPGNSTMWTEEMMWNASGLAKTMLDFEGELRCQKY